MSRRALPRFSEVEGCTQTGKGRCRSTSCRYSLRPHWVKFGGLPRQFPACALEVAASNPDGITLDGIGAILGVTRQCVEQIESRALAKIAQWGRRAPESFSMFRRD